MTTPNKVNFELMVDPYLVRVLNKAIGRELTAPPPLTYPFCLASYDDRFVAFMSDLKLDMARTMHAEQKFEYYQKLKTGMHIRVELKASEQYRKKDGTLLFTPIAGQVRSDTGELITKQTITLVTIARTEAQV